MFLINVLKKKACFFLYLLTFLLLNCFITPKAHAFNEFDTSYYITYTVAENGTSVKVDEQITLINNLANVYAQEYQINLGKTTIEELRAWDSAGPLEPEVSQENNNTIIKLKFNQPVVGKDEKLEFYLSYFSPDYALKNGQVLEVGIPKMLASEDLKDYQVVLQIPTLFEEPILIVPEPEISRKEGSFNVFYFNKEQLADKGITASFGESQVFAFKLDYHLFNDTSELAYHEISLPPDSPWQKVYYDTINPVPENITVDLDGNWLAKYLLKPGDNIDPTVSGSVEVFLQPETEIRKQLVNDPSLYLKELKYWEVENEQIQKLAKELKTIENIYAYVVDNLTYDYDRVNQAPERLGALTALNNREKAVCLEFSDLFIALSRAAGIPAREVNGFAYTNNPQLKPLSLTKDILHAWPEYYDQERNLWVGLDPTWEHTTGGIDFFTQMGLNHFAFSFHGIDSEYPYAAGAYKLPGEESKDVQVDFGSKPAKSEKFSLDLDVAEKVIAGKKIKGKVKIKNIGNVAIYDPVVKILPPFSSFEKEVVFSKTKMFDQGKITVKYGFRHLNQTREVEIVSPFKAYLLPSGAVLILVLIVFILLPKGIKFLRIKYSRKKQTY